MKAAEVQKCPSPVDKERSAATQVSRPEEPEKLTEVPIIDFDLFLNGSDVKAAELECKKVIQSFH